VHLTRTNAILPRRPNQCKDLLARRYVASENIPEEERTPTSNPKPGLRAPKHEAYERCPGSDFK